MVSRGGWHLLLIRWIVGAGILACLLGAVTGCAAKDARSPTAAQRTPPAGTILLYSRDGCPYCTQARDFLDRRAIPYVVRQVDQDRSAFDELALLYRQKLPGFRVVVPLVVFGEQVVSGFDAEELAEQLSRWQAQRGASVRQ